MPLEGIVSSTVLILQHWIKSNTIICVLFSSYVGQLHWGIYQSKVLKQVAACSWGIFAACVEVIGSYGSWVRLPPVYTLGGSFLERKNIKQEPFPLIPRIFNKCATYFFYFDRVYNFITHPSWETHLPTYIVYNLVRNWLFHHIFVGRRNQNIFLRRLQKVIGSTEP
jgi:hypothetical protein